MRAANEAQAEVLVIDESAGGGAAGAASGGVADGKGGASSRGVVIDSHASSPPRHSVPGGGRHSPGPSPRSLRPAAPAPADVAAGALRRPVAQHGAPPTDGAAAGGSDAGARRKVIAVTDALAGGGGLPVRMPRESLRSPRRDANSLPMLRPPPANTRSLSAANAAAANAGLPGHDDISLPPLRPQPAPAQRAQSLPMMRPPIQKLSPMQPLPRRQANCSPSDSPKASRGPWCAMEETHLEPSAAAATPSAQPFIAAAAPCTGPYASAHAG